MKLLQGGNNWIESGQLLARVHLHAGGNPLGNQGLDILYDDGLVLDEEVQLGGFLERKYIHVTRSREHQLIIKEKQLGMDHGVREIDFDRSSTVEVVDSPVVHVVTNIGFSGEEYCYVDSPGSSLHEGIRKFRVSKIGDLDVDGLLGLPDKV